MRLLSSFTGVNTSVTEVEQRVFEICKPESGNLTIIAADPTFALQMCLPSRSEKQYIRNVMTQDR